MIAQKLSQVKNISRRSLLVLQGLVLAAATILPLVISGSAGASQLTNRLVTASTAVPSATAVTLTFQFRLTNSTAAVQAVQIEFCDTPLGVCATTNTPNIASAAYGAINANWTNATAFGTLTLINGYSGGTANAIQVIRTQTALETQSGSLDRTISFTGIINNAGVNKSYYPRVRLYSINAAITSASTPTNDGVVAQSTSQTLTINGRVAEQLTFCVGTSVTDSAITQLMNNGGGSPVAIVTCTQADGTTVDLGSIGSGGASTTPVLAANGGSGTLAYALISTNSQNGATLGYRAVQDAGFGGRLKITGQTCSGSSTLDAGSGVTDQCFNSAAGARTNWAAAPEKFGMTIPGINCGSVPAGTYSCVFSTGTTNMQPQTNYNGDVYTYGTTATYGVSNGFAWDQSGSTTTIASSATSTIKVVAYEAVMLKFSALAAVTTPTGQYTASADFIATPTF